MNEPPEVCGFRAMLVSRRDRALLVGLSLLGSAVARADQPTEFPNQGGIVNTAHNLTQSPLGSGAVTMDRYRNNYGEVCVYCHTPHGASTAVQAPLWNRTASSATYTTYDELGTATLTGTVTAPGPNSLTCLSCHDGTVAVDSIINMPGSGGYDAGQQFAQNNTFLDQWDNPSGTDATNHFRLVGPPNENTGCLVCHSETGALGGERDFTMFAIGTDLRDDHPVGVELPDTTVRDDFNNFTATVAGKLAFYDTNGNGRADSDEIRLYETGDGYEVECASCHDPHGVPSGGPGSLHQPSFLRISNTQSRLCQTCHNK